MAALAKSLGVHYAKVIRWLPSENPRTRRGRKLRKPTIPGADDLAAMEAKGWNVAWLLAGKGAPDATVTRPPVELAADLYAHVAARMEREGWTTADIEAVFDTPDDLMLWFEQETVKAFEQYVGRREFFNRKGQQVGEAFTDPNSPVPVPAPRKRPKGGR